MTDLVWENFLQTHGIAVQVHFVGRKRIEVLATTAGTLDWLRSPEVCTVMRWHVEQPLSHGKIVRRRIPGERPPQRGTYDVVLIVEMIHYALKSAFPEVDLHVTAYDDVG